MTSAAATTGSSDKYTQRLRTELKRIRGITLDDSAGPKPWRTYAAGSVTVCEREDFRYWISLTLTKDRDRFNELGSLHIQHALEALVNARTAPAWLAFPGGILRAPIDEEEDAETDAEAFVEQYLATEPEIETSLQTLTKQGLEGIVLGVDNSNRDAWPQVPVKVRWTKGAFSVEALARRSDDEVEVPDERTETRRFGKSTSVFVSYCNEIASISASQSSSCGVQLGDQQSAAIVLDLAHYFRSARLPCPRDVTSRSGINYFMRSCANGAGRLSAPVIVSTALVSRDPCEVPSDASRPSFWLATEAPLSGQTPDASCYFAPKKILVVRDADDAPALTIHLHD